MFIACAGLPTMAISASFYTGVNVAGAALSDRSELPLGRVGDLCFSFGMKCWDLSESYSAQDACQDNPHFLVVMHNDSQLG